MKPQTISEMIAISAKADNRIVTFRTEGNHFIADGAVLDFTHTGIVKMFEDQEPDLELDNVSNVEAEYMVDSNRLELTIDYRGF